jgi:hypothetical protein
LGGRIWRKTLRKIRPKKRGKWGRVILSIFLVGFDPLKGGFFFSWIFKKKKKIRHKGNEKQGVYHTMALLPFTLKRIILRQKEQIMETHKYFTMPKYNLPKKKSSKRN